MIAILPEVRSSLSSSGASQGLALHSAGKSSFINQDSQDVVPRACPEPRLPGDSRSWQADSRHFPPRRTLAIAWTSWHDLRKRKGVHVGNCIRQKGTDRLLVLKGRRWIPLALALLPNFKQFLKLEFSKHP
ncbi:rCG49990, partial [Rattus norvegicus]